MKNKIPSPYILEKLELKIQDYRLRYNNKVLFHTPNLRETNILKSPIVQSMLKYNDINIEDKPDIFKYVGRYWVYTSVIGSSEIGNNFSSV